METALSPENLRGFPKLDPGHVELRARIQWLEEKLARERALSDFKRKAEGPKEIRVWPVDRGDVCEACARAKQIGWCSEKNPDFKCPRA